MSLWTPYAEAPLDLTKPVKSERSPAPSPPSEHYYYPTGYEVPQPSYYPGYYHQAVLYAPSAQISPVSAGSICSGYEAATPMYPRPVSAAQLSPPESPASKIDYNIDADVLSDDPDFQAFERDAMQAMAEKNGGTLLGNNPRMRRAVLTSQAVDDTYRKQRERNNFAAKQSRDRRKLREIHLALKVAFLKNEVGKMKTLLAAKKCVTCSRSFDS